MNARIRRLHPPRSPPFNCQWNVREAPDPIRTSTTYEEHGLSAAHAPGLDAILREQGWRKRSCPRPRPRARSFSPRNALVAPAQLSCAAPSRASRGLTAQRIGGSDRCGTLPARCASEAVQCYDGEGRNASSELLLICRAGKTERAPRNIHGARSLSTC